MSTSSKTGRYAAFPTVIMQQELPHSLPCSASSTKKRDFTSHGIKIPCSTFRRKCVARRRRCRPSSTTACPVGLFDTYIYKEYGILTSQAIQEQYHKIITDSRRKYKLPLEQFWLIKEGEDGTENNSAEIRNNINSKGTEVYEAESHIVGAEVNAIKTGINITATEVTKTKTGIDTTGTNIHAAGTGINATKTVTDEAAMKINAAKNREIAATIPQTKQETDTEIESKSETDTEIKSKPERERERERDKERERQSKTEK